MDQALKSLRWIWQWELSNCIYVCVYLRVCALTKSRKESQIRLLFSPTSYFYFVFISKGTIVYGEGSRGFFLLFFLHIFLSPCLLVLRVIIHQGLFNCQTQQKVIRPLLFPAPTPAFSSDKSSLCWVVSSFHKDPSSSHKLETLFYFISRQPLMNVWRLGMLQLMLCPWTISSLTN